MPKFFRDLNHREFFNPTWISVLINPFFFIKRGIFRGIKANASYMKGVMLDFGCGPKPYQYIFNVDKYVGLDFGESGHNHQNSQIDVLYDGQRIPFSDGAFDSVLAAEVFEHVRDLDKILSELFRIMKPDAYILITIPFTWEEHETPNDFVRFTSYGITALLEKKGFRIVNTSKSSNYVETCFQIWIAYVNQHLLPMNKVLKPLLITVIIFPLTLIGIIMSRLLPEGKALYLNNVILAQK